MNFDLGEILTRAGQITWKHKVFWLFSALPTLLSFVIVPFVFVPLILTDFDASRPPFFVEQPVYFVVIFIASLFISVLSYVLYGVASASVALGVLRADGGAEPLTLRDLFDGGQKYWWRVLGVTLLVGLAVSLAFFILFGCMALIGLVTVGLGFICLQPLFFLLYPLMLALYGVIEESLAAVVVDDLGVTDALQRGWELVKANFWPILLLSFIVYFALSLLGGLVAIPFSIPFFFFPFLMDGPSELKPQTILMVIGGLTMLLLPVLALVQGVGMTFLKAAYTLTYLRLTRPKADAAPAGEANA